MMVHGFGLTSLPHYIIQMAQKWHTYVTHVHAVCFQLKQWHRIKPWGCRMIVLFGNSACHSWKWLDCGRSAEIYRSSPSVPQAWLVNGSKWQSTMSHAWISGRPEGSDCSCPAITCSILLYWLYWGCWAHEGLLNSAAQILKLLEALDQMVPPCAPWPLPGICSQQWSDWQAEFRFQSHRHPIWPSRIGALAARPRCKCQPGHEPLPRRQPAKGHCMARNTQGCRGMSKDVKRQGAPSIKPLHLGSCDYITSLHPVTLARLPLRVHWRIGYIPK